MLDSSDHKAKSCGAEGRMEVPSCMLLFASGVTEAGLRLGYFEYPKNSLKVLSSFCTFSFIFPPPIFFYASTVGIEGTLLTGMQSSPSIKPKHDQQLCYPFPQNFTQPHELRENILSSSDFEQPSCSSGMKSPHLTHHNPGVGSSFLLRRGNWHYPGNWCVLNSS